MESPGRPFRRRWPSTHDLDLRRGLHAPCVFCVETESFACTAESMNRVLFALEKSWSESMIMMTISSAGEKIKTIVWPTVVNLGIECYVSSLLFGAKYICYAICVLFFAVWFRGKLRGLAASFFGFLGFGSTKQYWGKAAERSQAAERVADAALDAKARRIAAQRAAEAAEATEAVRQSRGKKQD